MQRIAVLCATAALVLMATACSEKKDTREADAKALRDNEAQWNKDYVVKDIDKLVSHYADDAALMGPGMASSSGKGAIRSTLKQMLSDPALSLKFEASKVEVAKSGDLAYTQGTYKMALTDPRTKKLTTDHGSYVTTYRKQTDGTWKAVSDIATSEVPPPAPAPAPAVSKKAKGKRRQ